VHAFAHVTCSRAGHEPVPSHAAPTTATPSVQLAGRQDTVGPGYTQTSRVVPSQVPLHADPSVEHPILGACGAAFTTGEHTPVLPATLHASHCPEQRPSQHTLSTQKPVTHCPSEEQPFPLATSGTHFPPEQ
jgi:hypothetical protein